MNIILRIRLTIILLISLVLGFSACHQQDSDMIIDIDVENTDMIDLMLSDIADFFKLIPLETTDECLLDYRIDFYVGTEYIIAFSENGVFKFSPEGKFEKKLFGLGRGPDEFTDLRICIL